MPERAAVPTVLAEDERVRVTRWDFAPGASTGWHRHGHPYAVIPMTECRFLLLEPGGAERRVTVAAGAAYARPPGVEHESVNGGDSEMSFIEVEVLL
jgi:quercetin dioxygenase-like cupin family protein